MASRDPCLGDRRSALLTVMMMVMMLMLMKRAAAAAAAADRCVSSPCQNGGTCVDKVEDYECICPNDPLIYVGRNCELLYDACVHVNCSNCIAAPGTVNYTCQCAEGFGGPDCTLDINECESSPCTGVQSHCVDEVNGYSCYCPSGYSGDDCQTHVRDCSNDPCFNNATCVWAPTGYECRCAPGFQGSHCEQDIDECLSQPCQNGAICQDSINVYQCFCVPGFQGYHCEIDINECASRPCENNGTCINGKDRYICDCLLGFTGVNCEVEIDECEVAPCQNGATCHDGVGLYICECLPGFEGIDCEVDIDECVTAPCLNNGACVDMVNSYECDCSGTGFVGDICEEDIPECASDPCQHGSTCLEGVNQYTCHCWPGYEGDNCEVDVDECKAQPCENGGQCFQRSDQSHYGVLPELDVDFSYEHAAGFLCHCQPGFTGENCSVNIDECESMPCENFGSCEDMINAFQCICTPGFTGVVCERNIDECENNPCQNGATCEDGINEYICHCPAPLPDQLPWGGHHCDIALMGCVDHACQNGASCFPSLQGDQHEYSCICPSGYYGDRCSVSTTFSFHTEDYVALEVPHNMTLKEIRPRVPSVVLSFRTTLPDVILFFRGSEEHFFSLEMNGGNLLATAESGDLKLAVQLPGDFNDGLWHRVSVSVDEKLVMILENTDYRIVEDGGHNHLLVFPQHGLENVYIGGVLPEHLDKTKTQTGFIGCMEDLLIDAQPILPQSIPPEEAKNIKLGCEKTEWCNPNSCSLQGHCVDLWTEYRCDCYRPFYGNICNHEHTSWTFSHERNRSFAAFPITQNHDGNMTLSLFLRSLKDDGLVFQLKRGSWAYFTVFLRRGTIHVAVYSTVRGSSVFVTDGERTMITVDIQGRYLYFNHTELLFSPENFTGFKVEAGDMAFLGGLPEVDSTAQWGGHFKGCLQDVRLDDIQLYINQRIQNPEQPTYFSSISYNLLENCISDQACRMEPCLNGGECLLKWNDFECSCPLNYTGKTCDTRVWCVSDPCVMGSQCVDLPDGYECLANATFENNALKYAANGSLSASVTTVSVELRTREESGTLLRASNGLEFFCMGLLNSSLLIKIRSGDTLDVQAFASDVDVSDGAWHRVELKKSPRHLASRWHLIVDGRPSGFSRVVPGNLDFFNYSTVWLAENFTGCLGEVRVGGVYLPLVEGLQVQEPQGPQFTRYGGMAEPQLGCIGAPMCLSEPCLNNGECRDIFNHYSCDCAPGWGGEHCQDDIDECASGPCVHGTCRDLLGKYQCECSSGYGGLHCDEDVDECQKQPCEHGGSCVNTVGGYNCTCPPDYRGPRCQWSYPPLQCEVDVQCTNGGVCMDGLWGANCTCKPGYIGDKCEVDIDECESNPCLNGATCMDRQNHYLCDCLPGFSGDNCEATRQPHRERIPWLVVAIPLMCLGALLAVVGLVCMVLTARKKRQSEGTYSPSQQEVAGARLEMGSVLKVPPEERLI
ncbi:protein crumbs homolog 2b isoform X2 [Salminus brasiliensis]|uniref:protein crumbs homolog 2b isoform X2 n=1 Tax=Salminus brasiliensis TaxID=930266 RepID=UPI003B833FE0